MINHGKQKKTPKTHGDVLIDSKALKPSNQTKSVVFFSQAFQTTHPWELLM